MILYEVEFVLIVVRIFHCMQCSFLVYLYSLKSCAEHSVKMFHSGDMCDISECTMIVSWHRKQSLGFTDSCGTQPFSFSLLFHRGIVIGYHCCFFKYQAVYKQDPNADNSYGALKPFKCDQSWRISTNVSLRISQKQYKIDA